MKIIIVGVVFVILLSACNVEGGETAVIPAENSPGSQAAATVSAVHPRAYLFAVTTNHEWQPVVSERKNVEMVLVPSGCFMMGATEQQAQIDQDQCNAEITNCGGVSNFDETPQHEVCFEEPFWIDRHEVSNADFGRASYAEADLPRTLVNWPDAQAHCELRGGRLPTEAEWEYAARGPGSWRYPWGGELQEGTVANFCDANCLFDWKYSLVDDGYAGAAPIGAFPTDASWVGALDMSGNVTEWTHSVYMPLPYHEDDVREAGALDAASIRTIKGGSFRTVLNRLRSSFRFGLQPLELNQALGFRCMLPYGQNE